MMRKQNKFSSLFTFALISVCATQYIDDPCKLPKNRKGICVLLQNCPAAMIAIRKSLHPQICGFSGKEPIVCCEILGNPASPLLPTLEPFTAIEDSSPGSKSQKKCDEYHPYHIFVVNGEQSLAKEFPHMAAIGFGDAKDIQWNCGGSLISELYVLTAAHCLFSRDFGNVRWARLGDLNLRISTDDAQPQDFEIVDRIPHPEYQPPLQYNDIALLRLDRMAKLNDYVKPICLQTTYQLPDVTNDPIATGWGYTQVGGEASDILMKVSLSYFNYKDCNKTYGGVGKKRLPKGIVDETQLCAGGRGDEKDTCQGDSGGPLQIFNVRYYLIGITSFGKACGIANSPGVYTRVSNYIPWIESMVWPD